jgi:ABC-type transport system involved in cytochrome c biogenesis ATPase subunit
MATIGFLAMARQFPGLVRHAIRLGSQASRWDTAATIAANLASGVFTGYALLASTTVLQALFAAGLYQPDSGAVWWDRTPTADMDPDQLRERIAVIAQDHVNWPLTVAHNIVMGRPADDRELTRAARVAGADAVIGELPRGFGTLLDRQFAGGFELSGGQRQRIAVARGFYRAAPLLIMDEPTAALDARAEYAPVLVIPPARPGPQRADHHAPPGQRAPGRSRLRPARRPGDRAGHARGADGAARSLRRALPPAGLPVRSRARLAGSPGPSADRGLRFLSGRESGWRAVPVPSAEPAGRRLRFRQSAAVPRLARQSG